MSSEMLGKLLQSLFGRKSKDADQDKKRSNSTAKPKSRPKSEIVRSTSTATNATGKRSNLAGRLRGRSVGTAEPSNTLNTVEVQLPAAYQGSYSTIYKGYYEGRPVAVRAVRSVRVMEGTRKELQRERAVWFNLNHDNVQPLLSLVSRPDLSPYDCTVSPWCGFGNLSEYMKKEQLNPRLRLRLAQDVAKGIAYLHDLDPSIVHGDLKPGNVLIDSRNRAIVCDFGISQAIRNELSKDMTTTVSKVNSLRYIAYELAIGITSEEPTTQSDVWSLACVIYEIVYSQVPYAHIPTTGNASQLALYTGIRNRQPPAKRPKSLPKAVTQLWKAVFEPAWNSQPKKRPTAISISQHLEQHETALLNGLPS